ncbi:MAG TPA: hypothetical protein VGT02_04510 [Methylomirabilota bacterium]|nr:hypothetical protein [Methylomirabilota bacterium]
MVRPVWILVLLLAGFASPAVAAFDLEASFTAPVNLPLGQAPAGTAMTFAVRIKNNGPDSGPAGLRVSLRRFDRTGQQFLAAVDRPKDLPVLRAGSSVTLTFVDPSPPVGSFVYKIGLGPGNFTDADDSNHRAETFVRYVAVFRPKTVTTTGLTVTGMRFMPVTVTTGGLTVTGMRFTPVTITTGGLTVTGERP